MGARRRLIAAAIVFAAASGPACKSKEPPSTAPPAPSKHTDHLAKGELAEGRERAFTLPLPLHSSIKARFQGSIHASSPNTQEEVVNFVRARVDEGTRSSGASETRFDNVVVKSDRSRRITVEIRAAGTAGDHHSQLVVSDVTPAPVDPNISEEERWRRAGMTPNGKLIDPKHMQ